MELLNILAEDNNGKVIHIKNAVKGVDYYCPKCKEKLTLKKGNIRQQHFSHNSSSDCTGTGEGYLHKAFKKMLLEIIKNNVMNKLPMVIYWKCNVCNMDHNGDILNGIIDAKEEYNLIECRPDIVLVNNKGKVNIIIEIVYKHEPEKNVIDYCIKNNIILLRIKLNSIEDLENIEDRITHSSNLIFFNKMNCPNFANAVMQQKQLNAQILLRNNRNIQRSPSIDQIAAAHANKEKRKYYAIKNYYKNKPKKK